MISYSFNTTITTEYVYGDQDLIIPIGYRITAFRIPAIGEPFIDSFGRLDVCKVKWGNLYPRLILEKIPMRKVRTLKVYDGPYKGLTEGHIGSININGTVNYVLSDTTTEEPI